MVFCEEDNKIFYHSIRQPFYNNISNLKNKNMYYNQSCAAKGAYSGSRQQHQLIRSMQRAAVNIYKTENSFEMLVFAPGRIRENFHLNVKGNELVVSYLPPEGFPRPEWVVREYSRGAFERSFTLDETVDASKITAKYADGVLQVSLPIIPGKETSNQEIPVS
jgi:HSP20 family protein